MLRTNSKKACENIRDYIMTDSDYIKERANDCGTNLETKNDFLVFAWECFKEEKSFEIKRNHNFPSFEIFRDWASGLAFGGLFCYYYNRSAVDDLGEILEETESEKAKYTEQEAEEMLSRLIYREMRKAAEKTV